MWPLCLRHAPDFLMDLFRSPKSATPSGVADFKFLMKRASMSKISAQQAACLIAKIRKTAAISKSAKSEEKPVSSVASRVASRWLTASASFDWSGLTKTIDKAAEGDEASKKKVHEYFGDTCVKENILKPQDAKDILAAFDKLVESKNDQQQQVEFSKLLKPMFKQHFKL